MHVVFDLDGVLLDSEADLAWLERALRKTLEFLGVDPDPANLELLFPANVKTLERAADAFEVPLAELWAVRHEQYTTEKVRAIRTGEIEPFDDVGVVREIAREHPVSILSNSPGGVVDAFVSAADLEDVVTCRIGRGADLSAIDRLKPDPHLFEELVDCAGADEYLYVGDSPDDEVFAERTGMAYIHLDRRPAERTVEGTPADGDQPADTSLTANLGRRESSEARAARDGRAARSLAEVRDRIETIADSSAGFSPGRADTLAMTDFAFETTIPVRYRDLDTYGHVNNATFGTYMEEARIAYLREVLDLEEDARGMLVASLSIDFHAPIDADAVRVGAGITRIGEKSFEFAYELEADGRTVATAESVQVAYDIDAGETIPFPEPWREAVQEYEDGHVEFGKPDED